MITSNVAHEQLMDSVGPALYSIWNLEMLDRKIDGRRTRRKFWKKIDMMPLNGEPTPTPTQKQVQVLTEELNPSNRRVSAVEHPGFVSFDRRASKLH